MSILTKPDIASMLMEAIRFRCVKNEWRALEYVIMPNHKHLFLEIHGISLIRSILEFKRWTGHQAIKILNREGELFWANEWFDHWSRTPEEEEKIIHYIRQNPVKAGLVMNYKSWRYGGWCAVDSP